MRRASRSQASAGSQPDCPTRHPRAESELQALLKQYPKNSAVQTQAGIVLAMKGDRPGAARSLARALELDENNLEALAASSRSTCLRRTHASAISRVEDATQKNSTTTPQSCCLPQAHMPPPATWRSRNRCCEKMVEVDASNFQAYGMLGRLYLVAAAARRSASGIRCALETPARPVQAHTLVGVILEAQKKPQEARKRYEQALALDPEMPVAANNLAWMYAETGENLDMALQLAQAAARRLPNNPAIQDTLGWIYYKKGLATLAIAPFQKSIELDPKNPVFHYHLGLAHLKNGDSPKARIALRDALALAPNFAGAAEAKQVLASLKG